LWVNLQLINICRQRSDEDIEAELYNMPRGLDRTYAQILQRIQHHPTALRELARRCLMWIFYAARPLHIKELLEAVQIGESAGKRENFPRYEEEAVIEACANLIEVNYGFVRPIHFSVKEYFISPESTAQPESTIQESPRELFVKSTMAHTLLSHSCLSYLLQGFLDAGPCKDEFALYRRLMAYRLASYSSYFFDNHLRQFSEVPKELRKLLKNFLSSRSTAFAAMMQLRALCGRACDINTVTNLFTTMLQEMDASTVIRSTTLLDHPGLYDDIKNLLPASTPKYIMHQTASSGLLTYTAHLIQEGYQVDERDPQNRTPLYYASRNGQREICRLLLKHGANVGVMVDNGGTALHGAAFGGHEAMVRLLVEDYKADVEAKANDGRTVLHWAVSGGNEAVVRLLIEDYKAGVEAKANDGRTVLHWAVSGGNEAVVRLLLEDYKADVKTKDNDSRTVLYLAAFSGNEVVVRLLIEDYKADVGAKDNDGRTVLYYATLGGNEAVVRLLLEDYKADVEAKTNDGTTVLHAAAAGGNEAVVRLLVEDYKADVAAKDNDGKTALHLAEDEENEMAVRVLKSAEHTRQDSQLPHLPP
jgi:ankyrin repeat protein